MAKKIAKFEIISKENYDAIILRNDFNNVISYDEIKKPERSTMGSAGYDFYATKDISLEPGESTVVYTFIRCRINEDWALLCMPKSGLGFKYHVVLANTLGLIDSDYYNTKTDDDTNEGQIMIKLVNMGDKTLEISRGSKFCQAVFFEYGITEDDECDKKRNGGLGSTGNK